MGRIFTVSLSENNPVIVCRRCHTHLTTPELLVSDAFHGRHGPASLFDRVVNIIEGPLQERMLATGLHQVRDIQCVMCEALIGWKYIKAYSPQQKYKERKVILERNLVAYVN